MPNWRESVNQAVGVDRISDISIFVRSENFNTTAPIDVFYRETKAIMTAATPASLNSNTWMGALYAIAIVSCTENYMRDIFCQILKICPESQKKAANNTVNLGSVLWHPSDAVERGAFENLSLAGAESIKKTAKQFIGMDFKQRGLEPILAEFDKVCELRHGIVHSGRVLAGKNGMKLKLPPSDDILRIEIQYAELQEICSVCTTLIASCNKELFELLAMRWATSWRATPSWDPSNESPLFKRLWLVFHSSIDNANGTIPHRSTWVKCRNLVKQEFNV